MSATPPTPPRHTWLPMSLWTAGILLVLGLAWFIGAEVVPILRTRSAVADFAAHQNQAGASTIVFPHNFIVRIGPPPQAARRLVQYVHLPRWLAPHRTAAVTLLASCHEAAVPALAGMLHDADESLRESAAWGLGATQDAGAAEPLIGALADSHPKVRRSAAEALGALLGPWMSVPVFNGGSEQPRSIARRKAVAAATKIAVPALEEALEDSTPEVRAAAAEALKKIRGGETGK